MKMIFSADNLRFGSDGEFFEKGFSGVVVEDGDAGVLLAGHLEQERHAQSALSAVQVQMIMAVLDELIDQLLTGDGAQVTVALK